MQASLVHHPHTQASPIAAILVEVTRDGCSLELTYRVTGGFSDLLIPDPAVPERADELWQHTCLEAFVATRAGDAYVEINLSPSTQWALYGFTGYRQGMTAPDVASPRVHAEVGADRLVLDTVVDLAGLLPKREDWLLGLAAVIEDRSGGKSYWALAHRAGPPDFHHRDCFTLQLPPAMR